MGWNWGNLIDPSAWASGLKDAFGIGAGDDVNKASNQAIANMQQQGRMASDFASVGESNYGQRGNDLQAQADYLRRLASGQDSVSAEQLRQGLGQNLAQQRSLQASAAPQDQAMAALNAAQNSARLGYGASGQQALAGLQERQQAQQALSQMLLGQRGQDLQAAIGSRGNALQGYGAGVRPLQPTSGQQVLGAVTGLLGLGSQGGGGGGGGGGQSWSYGGSGSPGAGGGWTYSDRRLKKEVEDADEKASRTLGALRAYSYRYKDEAHGVGEQLGVMAQDLEKAGLGHAVVDTPRGKAVDGAKLATSNTAMLSALARRVAKLEGGAA